MYTLIQTAKLNEVAPQAWLADVLARIADTPHTRLAEAAAVELDRQSKATEGRLTAAPTGRLRQSDPDVQTNGDQR